MARPQKKTLDYYNHDCAQGETIFILQQKYGNDGYAFWYKVLEKLGSSEGHYLDLNQFKTRCHLAAYCLLSEDKVMEILGVLAELEAIDKIAWRTKKIIWCQNFVDRHQEVYDRRKGVSVPINPVNGTINSAQQTLAGVNDNNNPQTKLNYTKVNKTKVKELYEKAFKIFWDVYPPRNGKKLRKQDALKEFLKLPQSELKRVIRNARNYAASDTLAKDPARFLKNDFWQEWDTPGEINPENRDKDQMTQDNQLQHESFKGVDFGTAT